MFHAAPSTKNLYRASAERCSAARAERCSAHVAARETLVGVLLLRFRVLFDAAASNVQRFAFWRLLCPP